MKPSVLSFLDEMQKIASVKTKEAGAMRDLSNWTLKQGRGVRRNVYWASKRMIHPMEGMAHGLKFIKRDLTNPHTNPFWKAMIAYGFVSGAPEAFAKEDPTGAHRSRLNRMTRFTGAQVGNIIGAPYGMVGGTLAGLAGEAAGAVLGNGIDRVRGLRLHKPTNLQASNTPLGMVAPKVGYK